MALESIDRLARAAGQRIKQIQFKFPVVRRDPAELEAFQQVLARPLDDSKRKRYAEVTSDSAHAEFILAQLRVSRVADGTSPAATLFDRRTAESLLSDHEREWAAEIKRLVDYYTFNRGFIELVGLDAESFIGSAERLLAAAPIIHLDLTNVKRVAQELFECPHLKQIHSLSLDNSELEDQEVTWLANSAYLENLRWLSLAYNRVGREGITQLVQAHPMRNLQYVNLYGNPADPRQRYAHDSGRIVSTWFADDDLSIELCGRKAPWFYRTPDREVDLRPDRFRIVGQDGSLEGNVVRSETRGAAVAAGA
jgi:hypothetical protein